MRYFVSVVLFFLFQFCITSLNAAPCNIDDLPEGLAELVKQKKNDEAVKQAKAVYEKNTGDKSAALNLARVYIHATLVSALNFDMDKMGFKPGESGAKEITLDMLEQATSSRIMIDPAYLDEGSQHIKQVVSRWPDSRNLYYCLTKIYFYKGDRAEFFNSLSTTAGLFKDSEKEAVDFLIDYGTELMQSEDYRTAEKVYSTLLEIFPESVPLLSSLGVAYISQGYTIKAAEYFDRAYSHDSNDPIVIGNITESAMLLGDFKKAEKFLLKKAEKSPNDAAVYFDLAINAIHENPEASNRYWKKYFEVHAQHPDDEQWAKNAEIIQRAANDKTALSDWHELAQQMIESGVPKYAIPVLHYIEQNQPDDATVSYTRAYAYDRGRHYDLQEKALLETLRRIELTKNQQQIDIDQVYYNLSRSSYVLDNDEQALKYLSLLSDKMKQMPNIEYMHGLIYRDLGDSQKAGSYFKNCVQKAKQKSLKELCQSKLAD